MRRILGLGALAGLLFVAGGRQALTAAEEENLAPVIITAQLPADAEIWFGDTKTTETGALRRFESPPISTGKAFRYEVRVAGPGDLNLSRALTVRGGERIALEIRDGQLRETRSTGTGSAYFAPPAGRPVPFSATPSSRPTVTPLGGNSYPGSQPYGMAGAVGGG